MEKTKTIKVSFVARYSMEVKVSDDVKAVEDLSSAEYTKIWDDFDKKIRDETVDGDLDIWEIEREPKGGF